MDYKKIKRDNYTLHLINTERFKSIDLVIYFSKEFDKKDIAYMSLLSHALTYTSKKYNTKNKIAKKSEYLYGLNFNVFSENNGNLLNFVVHSNFLNPKYTSDQYYYESIDYIFEVLLNPNVKNNAFDSKYFNIVKNDIITAIKATKDNPNRYASLEFNKIMYKGTPKSYDYKPTIKEINKITEKDLYSFYKRLFNKEYKIDVILLGELEENKLPYIENKLKTFKQTNEKLKINIKEKHSNKLIKKIDTLHFNQSKLYLGYRLNNFTDYELKYVIRVYNTILGTMNDSILFNVVREKNSLCYSINSYYSRFYKTLVVYSGINKNNYEKTVKLVEECIKKMTDTKTINKLIIPAKKTINTYLNSYYDDAVVQITDKIRSEFEEVLDIEETREILNNVTPEEILNISSKIKLSVIYLLKGDN